MSLGVEMVVSAEHGATSRAARAARTFAVILVGAAFLLGACAPTQSAEESGPASPSPAATTAAEVPSASPTPEPPPTRTPAPTAEPLADTGRWEVSSSKDELTGEPKAIARLEAESGASLSGPYVLIYRCAEKTLDLYLVWDEYLGSDDPEVTVRLDEGEINTVTGYLSTDSTTTFFDGSGLADRLRGATRFVARVTPYNEGAVTAVFDVTGAEAAMSQVDEVCGR